MVQTNNIILYNEMYIRYENYLLKIMKFPLRTVTIVCHFNIFVMFSLMHMLLVLKNMFILVHMKQPIVCLMKLSIMHNEYCDVKETGG